MDEQSISVRMFDGWRAESALSDQLRNAGIEFERVGFDDYDNSLELHGVAPDGRLSIEAQKAIHAAGFSKVYVNHTDQWETHYNWPAAFTSHPGWRVSYRNKFGGKEIWVEKPVPSWPEDWVTSGYVIIKAPDSASATS